MLLNNNVAKLFDIYNNFAGQENCKEKFAEN